MSAERQAGHDGFQMETGKLSIFEPLWSGIGRQLHLPSGRWGRFMGHLMWVVNAQPNRLAIDALDLEPRDDVLELGFGPGRAIRMLGALVPDGHITGIDQSTDMLKQASLRNRRAIRKGQVYLGPGRFDDTGFPCASFDRLLAVNVAYFFNEDGREIREARRVLRPGGRMAIYVTDKQSMSGWKFTAPGGCHKLYDEAGLLNLLLRGGFNRPDVEIRRLRLALGITGLLAIATKPAQVPFPDSPDTT